MMAFSGRVWSVAWSNKRADDARRILMTIGDSAIRCGGAGAIWRVGGWEELSGQRVGATLFPVDGHDLNPTVGLYELPMPNEAT